MSFVPQGSWSVPRQPHTWVGHASNQMPPSGSIKATPPQVAQNMMDLALEALVIQYLEQYPNFLAWYLQKNELFLAKYLLDKYDMFLPMRYGVIAQTPAPLRPCNNATSNRPSSSATMHEPTSSSHHVYQHSMFSAQSMPPTYMPLPNAYQQASAVCSQDQDFWEPAAHASQPAPSAPQSTRSRGSSQILPGKPATGDSRHSSQQHQQDTSTSGTAQLVDSDPGNGTQTAVLPMPPSNIPDLLECPESTFLELLDEADKDVPYPTPKQYLDRQVGMEKGHGQKWSFEEQDLLIRHMLEIFHDLTIPQTQVRFAMGSNRLFNKDHIYRTPTAVKTFWNRIGRQRSEFDERRNKNAPLATSLQGKLARQNNQARKDSKRKAAEDPQEPVQKKARTARPKPTADIIDLIDPALDQPSAPPVAQASGYVLATSAPDDMTGTTDPETLQGDMSGSQMASSSAESYTPAWTEQSTFLPDSSAVETPSENLDMYSEIAGVSEEGLFGMPAFSPEVDALFAEADEARNAAEGKLDQDDAYLATALREHISQAPAANEGHK